ncbi:MAG TPA: hypothetical protein VHI31_04035, partial [Actinomycetota bacterium]|nr:hypothetical protein [Actinomycetota bacterium]
EILSLRVLTESRFDVDLPLLYFGQHVPVVAAHLSDVETRGWLTVYLHSRTLTFDRPVRHLQHLRLGWLGRLRLRALLSSKDLLDLGH